MYTLYGFEPLFENLIRGKKMDAKRKMLILNLSFASCDMDTFLEDHPFLDRQEIVDEFGHEGPFVYSTEKRCRMIEALKNKEY